MKTGFLKYIFLFFSMLAFVGCQEEDKVTYDDGASKPPVFTDPKLSESYKLDPKDADKTKFIEFSWIAASTNIPVAWNYSLVVSDGEAEATIKETQGLKAEFTVKELSDALGKIEADTSQSMPYTFSIKAQIVNEGGTGSYFYSNEYKTEIYPYPSTYRLFLVEKGDGGKVVDKARSITSAAPKHSYSGALDLKEGEYFFYTNDFNDGTADVYGLNEDGTKLVKDATVGYKSPAPAEGNETIKMSVSANLYDTYDFKASEVLPLLWVPGNHNGWSHEIKEIEDSTKNETYTHVNLISANNDGIYKGKVWLNGEFKFSEQAGWDGTNYGKDFDTDGLASNWNAADLKGTGLYNLEVNVNSKQLKVVEFTPPPVEMPEGNALWLVGDHNGWIPNVRDVLLETEEGSKVFTARLMLLGSFDIRTIILQDQELVVTKTYKSPTITADQLVGSIAEASDAVKYLIRVPEEGAYDVTVDMNDMTYEVEAYIPEPEPEYPATLHLKGGSTLIGWSDTEAIPLLGKDGVPGTYILFTPMLNKDGLKFTEDMTWNPNWGKGEEDGTIAPGTMDNNIIPDFVGPAFITADMINMTYSIVEGSIGIIGSATPNAWDSDTDMTYVSEGTWSVTADLVAGEWKFRAQDDWAYQLEAKEDGTLVHSTNAPAAKIEAGQEGNYTITIDLKTMTYTMVKN